MTKVSASNSDGQPHVHDFVLKIHRVKADNTKYKGVTRDRAILSWACACKFEYAFDYGPVRDMAAKFKEYTSRVSKSEVTPVS